jgi:hypothetical protein
LVVLVVGMIASHPDIAVVPMMAACVGVAVVVPIVAYPFTHTLWAAVDLAMRAGAGPARDEDA